MTLKVLVVDKSSTPAMALIEGFDSSEVQAVFVSKVDQAISNMKKNSYDLLIFGDKLVDGDTFDVGLEKTKSLKNRQTPVICLTYHPSRSTKLASLLRPHSFKLNLSDVASKEGCIKQVKELIKTVNSKK